MPDSKITAENLSIEGTWRLLACENWVNGKLDNPFHQGKNPNGLIHYLPGQRMSAIIAMGDRPKMGADRGTTSIDERAKAWSTFNAYAGPYSREGHRLTHHLEVCSYENHVGADYVRFIELDGQDMWLVSAPEKLPGGEERYVKLKWRRV
jgi:hypothetical protein